MNNNQNKSLAEQWVRGLGFKDILLVIMGLMVAFIFIFNGAFNKNTGYTKEQVEQLELLFQRRIDELNDQNESLLDSIADYKVEASKYLQSVAEREKVIADLERKERAQQRKIEELMKKREEVREEIQNLDDDELEQWWIDYFKNKE